MGVLGINDQISINAYLLLKSTEQFSSNTPHLISLTLECRLVWTIC